jgi:hypothetical protein
MTNNRKTLWAMIQSRGLTNGRDYRSTDACTMRAMLIQADRLHADSTLTAAHDSMLEVLDMDDLPSNARALYSHAVRTLAKLIDEVYTPAPAAPKALPPLAPNAQKLFEALKDNTEGCTITDEDGVEWGTVYIDNATHGLGFGGQQIGGLFSALKRRGLYRPEGERSAFGLVRIN